LRGKEKIEKKKNKKAKKEISLKNDRQTILEDSFGRNCTNNGQGRHRGEGHSLGFVSFKQGVREFGVNLL